MKLNNDGGHCVFAPKSISRFEMKSEYLTFYFPKSIIFPGLKAIYGPKSNAVAPSEVSGW